MKIVIDTNILVSALRTNGATPRAVLRLCLERKVTPLIGAALFAEYEDVLARSTLFEQSALAPEERESVFDALMSVSEWVSIYYLWRPNLRDEGDNHLIELAVAGGASWIITANLRDFRGAELRFDDLQINTATVFLETMEAKP